MKTILKETTIIGIGLALMLGACWVMSILLDAVLAFSRWIG